MLHVTKTKLWKSMFVSVRDYEVEQAIECGGMVLHFGSRTMTLSVDRLMKLRPEERTQISKTGGRNYQLVDILWEPEQ